MAKGAILSGAHTLRYLPGGQPSGIGGQPPITPAPVPPDVGTPTTLVAGYGTEYHIDNT
jgi:hypothetical protein